MDQENAFVRSAPRAHILTMNEAHIETIYVAGLELRYVRARRPGASTVLMNVAWPQSLLGVGALFPMLAAERDVIAFEMPGFGRSEGREDVMRPSAQAEVLVGLLDAFGLERAHVLALDVGVPMTLFALARHPRRFTGATLANGPGFSGAHFSTALAMLTRSALVRRSLSLAPGLFVRVADLQGHVMARTARDALADYVACYARGRLAGTFAYLASYAEATELPALDGLLQDVHTRVQILWGTKDAYLSTANAHALHARLPNATLTLLDHAGHFSHDDAPLDFARHVLEASAARSVGEGVAYDG